MRHRIVTLDSEGVAGACRRLESLCAGFRPDLIVGIAEGGVEVAGLLFPSADHFVIASPRSHRGAKGRWLSRLPVRLLDCLRVIELRFRRRRPVLTLPVLPPDLLAGAAKARSILIVDDAVDSGATLQAVVAAIRAAAPQAGVRSAVLTATRSNPIARPDYCCFSEGTILRFPWSLDAKK